MFKDRKTASMDELTAIVTAFSAWKWPATIVVGALIFRRDISAAIGRLRRGKISEFEFELDKLEEKATGAMSTSQELPPDQTLKVFSPTPERIMEREILAQAREAPKPALMLLASDIESELRDLLAGTGWHQMQRFTSVPAGIERLAAQTAIPEAVQEAMQQFWPVRNRLIHGHNVTDDDILRAIDAGMLILKSIRAIPREINIVYHPGVEVFSDPNGKQLMENVLALILETTGTDTGKKILRFYPTTRKDYIKGKRVAWEWSPRNKYGESWFRDPDSGEIKYGWSGSLEFIGRHLDDVQ